MNRGGCAMTKQNSIFLLMVTVLFCGAARAADFYTDVSYVLSTEFRGKDMCLDVHEGG